jgi:hypothetical protein
MSTQLDNLRVAHVVVNNRVIRALHTQVGDVAQLSVTRSQVLALLQAATQVRNEFSQVVFLIDRHSSASKV